MTFIFGFLSIVYFLSGILLVRYFLKILLFLSGTVLVMISVSGAYEEFQRYFYNLTYEDVKDENPWLRSFFHLQGTNSRIF